MRNGKKVQVIREQIGILAAMANFAGILEMVMASRHAKGTTRLMSIS